MGYGNGKWKCDISVLVKLHFYLQIMIYSKFIVVWNWYLMRKVCVPKFWTFIWILQDSACNSPPILGMKKDSIRCNLVIGADTNTHIIEPLYTQHDYMWLNVCNILWKIMLNRCILFVYVFWKCMNTNWYRSQFSPITLVELFIIGISLLTNQSRLLTRKSDLEFFFSLSYILHMMIIIEYWVDYIFFRYLGQRLKSFLTRQLWF